MNVGIPLMGENVLPDEELWVLCLGNRNVVNSQRKVIMELQHLPLQAASKLAHCTVSYSVVTRRPRLINTKSELLTQPGRSKGIQRPAVMHGTDKVVVKPYLPVLSVGPPTCCPLYSSWAPRSPQQLTK